jgi:hypothetical protein
VTPNSQLPLIDCSWRKISNGSNNVNSGRISSLNIFKVNPGIKKKYAQKIGCAKDAFMLFIDENMLREIKCFSEDNATPLLFEELQAFIGLQYARGIYGRAHSVNFLWNAQCGVQLFSFRRIYPQNRLLRLI